jgi:hypothetical protein
MGREWQTLQIIEKALTANEQERPFLVERYLLELKVIIQKEKTLDQTKQPDNVQTWRI